MRRLEPPTADYTLRALVLSSLAGVLGLGLVLRFWLAGVLVAPIGYAELRSAHSHLAYFGLILPAAWMRWRERGEPVPGPRTLLAYGGAVTVSTLAFVHSGYNAVSIAGSTAVLSVWLSWALPLLGRLRERSWAAVAGPIVLASASTIPAVALLSARGDPFAAELVHTFLAWLLFGVAVPAALDRSRAPAPPAWATATTVLGAGLALGPVAAPLARAALVVLGLGILAITARAPVGVVSRFGWWMVAAGFLGMGLGLIPKALPFVVAGLHFTVLGPVFVTLLRPAGSWLTRWPYAGALGLLAGSIAAPAVLGPGPWSVLAALSGTAVAALWLAALAGEPHSVGTPLERERALTRPDPRPTPARPPP